MSQTSPPPDPVQDPRPPDHTTCCIVGAGPAGAMLALLLVRRGIDVVLLEAHRDFDREFRGDTVHPSTMELLDELGLAERVLDRCHARMHDVTVQTADGPFTVADLRRLPTRFPFIAMVPQARLLEVLTAEASRSPHCHLVMGATVNELIEEAGEVRGVRYKHSDGEHAVRALLTIGADGRFSRLRKLSGVEMKKTSPPMDVLWFRLPRWPDDSEGFLGRFRNGRGLVMLNRGDHWQCGFVIPKGSFQALRSEGLAALHRSIVETAPELDDRTNTLTDWKQVSLLAVESSRALRWYRPGLLLIGDAAHVMSPVGGVGINYAIQDAVVAANLLTAPLLAGRVALKDLRAVQRRRAWPTRIIQAMQAQVQKRIIASGFRSGGSLRVPPLLRLLSKIPFLRDLPARLVAFGVWPVHLHLR